MAIKDINTDFTTNEANNNIDIGVDIGISIGKAINKMDAKLIVNKLHKANIIVKKKVYKSNLFWLLLTSNKNLALKIMS